MSPHSHSTTDQQQRNRTSRRRFLVLSGVGVGWALGAPPSPSEHDVATERLLRRGDKIDIGDRGKDIIERAYQLGYDYEKQHGG